MTEESVGTMIDKPQHQGPSTEFGGYCDAEIERRKNSGEPFDEASYREAMEMVLVKLRALEEEGYA